MAKCGDSGGVSANTGRPCEHTAGKWVYPITSTGKCRTHLEEITGYGGGVEVCGDYGGVAESTGRPCQRTSGWGFLGVVRGRCRSHTALPEGEATPSAQPPPPVQPVEPIPVGEVVPDDRIFQIRRLKIEYPVSGQKWVAVGQTVEATLTFLGGRNVHDSIVALPVTGVTIVQTGDFTWELTPTVPGSFEFILKVIRADVLDSLDRPRLIEYRRKIGVQVGAPTTHTIPSEYFDGSNRTASLQTWFNSRPNNAIIEGSGDLRSDNTLALTNRWGMQFQGNVRLYTEVNVARTDFKQLLFRGGGYIGINGWTIESSYVIGTSYTKSKETQHGLEFQGTEEVDVDDLTIRNVWGDWILLSPEPIVIRSAFGKVPGLEITKFADGIFIMQATSGIRIRNCLFRGSNRQGISPVSACDLLQQDCVMEEAGRTNWDVEPGGTMNWNDNLDFYRNTIRGFSNYLISTGGSGEWMQQVRLRENTVEGKPLYCKFAGGAERRDLYLTDNVADTPLSSSRKLIELGGWKGEAHFLRNAASDSRPRFNGPNFSTGLARGAIELDNCQIVPPNLRVEDNNFTDQNGNPLPLTYRQIHHQGNTKAGAVCRVIEKVSDATEPVIVVGSETSCDWDP